ncbi:MAG TPA: 16S rRNA (adenine(1518)-N(6)/adenine(1519)-N(6))-dimethyltransferase RsmA [Thermoguttaceae bacterium]|nr:16S rRNA (adenine(1518)-N(6)/adenine(1519)-N(6))-dimethyltransferase RsmA [Thermoguttaceae bacterium]
MTGSEQRQTLSFLRQRFAEAGIDLHKKLGQNFLIDLNLVRLIADSAELGPDDVVLEVGTGAGSLTAMLAERAAVVVTVEIDEDLYRLACEHLVQFPNVVMLQMDALARKSQLNPQMLAEVEKHLAQKPNRRWKLAANLPYQIATPLLSNLLTLDRPPQLMTVTIQKELADRITAKPSTKDYGALSIWVQTQCTVELVRVMPPEVFWPRPKVSSAILRIRPDEAKRAQIPDRDFFHQFVRDLFQHRRKLLRSELLGAVKGRLDKADVDAVLAELGLTGQERAEALSPQQMLQLSETIRRHVT